jgi:hypothetical protein
MRIEPEINGASVVLIGRFNPVILQPAWLARHGVITDQESELAEVKVIHPEIASFKIEPLFTLSIDRTRYAMETTVAPFVRIADATSRIFGDLLSHTPVGMLGINRLVHFDVGSFERRDKIGELIAPREPWGEWGKAVSSGFGDRHGGLQSLTLVQKDVEGRRSGWIKAKIEPSTRIGGGQTGIFMEVNDHYQLDDPKEATDSAEMINLLTSNFDASMKNSETIIDEIMQLKDLNT